MEAGKHESGEGIQADRQDAASFYGVYGQELDELLDSLSTRREAGTGCPSPVLPRSYGQAAMDRLPEPSGQSGDMQSPAA